MRRSNDYNDYQEYGSSGRRPRKRGWLVIIVILVICYLVGGGGRNKNGNSTTSSTSRTTISSNTSQSVVNYLTEVDVASEISYMCAVEVPGYKYDNLKAGSYKVYMDCTRTKSAKETKDGKAVVPQIFDIYVVDKEYKNKYEFAASGVKPVLSIGGMGYKNEAYKLTLKPNQYVYIDPVKSDIINWSGILHFDWLE